MKKFWELKMTNGKCQREEEEEEEEEGEEEEEEEEDEEEKEKQQQQQVLSRCIATYILNDIYCIMEKLSKKYLWL